MGLRTLIKSVFDRSRFMGSTISTVEGFGTFGAKPWPFNYDLAMVHGLRSWAYRCILGNAEAAASVPLRLYVRKRSRLELKRMGYEFGELAHRTRRVPMKRLMRLHGELGNTPSRAVRRKIASFGDDFEEVTDHPIIDLLNNVNPDINGFDLSVGRFVYQQITGNAYLHPVMSLVYNRPTELWPMLPQWVWVVPGKRKPGEDAPYRLIDGYVYGKRSPEQKWFNPSEVLRFNSGVFADNLWYAKGPTEAAWQVMGTIYSRQVMDKATYDNMARPDWMLINEQMNPDQARKWKADIDRELKGVRKSGGWLAMGGKVTATAMNFAPKDLTVNDRYLEEVAGVYGYPITKLLANDPNRANAETGDAGWVKDTILAMLRRDEEALNQNGFLELFGDGELAENAVLAYDDPVPENRDLDLRETQALVAMGVALINEEREKRGLEPVDGGDVPRINGVPLDQAGQQAADPLAGLFGRLSYNPPGEKAVAADDTRASVEGGGVVVEGDGELLGGEDEGACDDADSQDVAISDAVSGGGDDERELTERKTGTDAATTKGHVDDDENNDGDGVGAAGGDDEVSVVEVSHKALMWSDQKCECGSEGMPISFKGWIKAKRDETGDAEDDVREGEPETPIDRLARTLRRFFEEQLRIVGETIGRTRTGSARKKNISEADIDRIVRSLSGMDEELAGELRDSMADMFQTGGAAGLERIGQTGDPFNVFNPKVTEFLNDYTVRLARDVNTFTVERIQATLTEGMQSGESIRDLSARIQRESQVSGARAETIARTESARAYVEGEQLAWRESGVVQGKRWLLAPDACEFCRAVAKEFNKKIVPLDGSFYKRGATLTGAEGGVMKLDYSDVKGPPLHPNDRCDVEPVLREVTE